MVGFRRTINQESGQNILRLMMGNLSTFWLVVSTQVINNIIYINSLRPWQSSGPSQKVDRARPVGRNFLFPEFSFERSVVSGPEFPVPRVFFSKICGFGARHSSRPGPAGFWSGWARSVGISCSQSFPLKDLWFPGRNFLFPEAAPISGRIVATNSS